MKTIFLTVFSGVEGKNILRSDVFRTLQAVPDLRLVFLVKNNFLARHFSAEFISPRISFMVSPKQARNFFERVFATLKFYLLRTETIDLHRRTHFEEDRNFVRYILSFAINRLLARPLVRCLIRFFDQHLIRNKAMAAVFEEYRPDLVFLADLFDDTETAILREAKCLGIKSVGLINTWDRTTSRWLIRLLPERFIVFNEIMKEELALYDDMPKEQIVISGTVQHDHLVKGGLTARADFYSAFKIPTSHRIIVYCPIGSLFDKQRTELDRGVIRLLSEAIKAGELGSDKLTLLVRFHPNDVVDLSIWGKYENVVYDIPGVKFDASLSDRVFARTRGQNWDMAESDLQHLRDTLHYASVIICYYTSLSIDAAVAGKPVININFDIKDGRVVSDAHPYYKSTHYLKAAATGGIRLVQNSEDLKNTLREYLKNPDTDLAGRQKLIASQCFKLDGNSGRRIAEMILGALKF